MIRGFSSFLLLNDSKAESESENMINFLCLMMLSARSIAQASAVKTELSIGKAFLRIVIFRTTAHAVVIAFGSIRENI